MANAWFAFYGGDYDRDTSHLTMIQDGAYFRMLRTYYATGQPLPVNSESLVRICGAHSQEEIEAISFILSSFFSLKSDGWHNKRADLEIKEARRISKLRRNARLNKRKTIVPTIDNQLQTQSQSQSHIHNKTLKPTLEEVRAYCAIRQNAVDPQKWFDHYAANGWRVGRNPMKDWKAAIRNWERNGVSNGQSGRNHQSQSAAVKRYVNNSIRFEEAFGSSMGEETEPNVAGHAPGLSSGPARLLED